MKEHAGCHDGYSWVPEIKAEPREIGNHFHEEQEEDAPHERKDKEIVHVDRCFPEAEGFIDSAESKEENR